MLRKYALATSTGTFSDLWKESFIVPLHKCGPRYCVQNYRCIAKLSVIPKLFERLITNSLIYSLSPIFQLINMDLCGFGLPLQCRYYLYRF